jgi:hypothetical protein
MTNADRYLFVGLAIRGDETLGVLDLPYQLMASSPDLARAAPF